MPLRPCIDCRTPTAGTRCKNCRSVKNRERDQARGSSTDRGYGAAHQAERARWAPLVEAGQAICWRCEQFIAPGSAWDLGHDDTDRSIWRGPECWSCNRGTRRRNN